ncbi:MAG: hypothetical protein ACOY90_12740 [Candidatus Zhuqueibacterota bacterium]
MVKLQYHPCMLYLIELVLSSHSVEREFSEWQPVYPGVDIRTIGFFPGLRSSGSLDFISLRRNWAIISQVCCRQFRRCYMLRFKDVAKIPADTSN